MITSLIAAFLLYIKEGNSPKEAIELATIDESPEFLLSDDKFPIRLESCKMTVFSFIKPEVDEKTKRCAAILKFSYLNFDRLEDNEIEKISKYLEEMKEYFK